MSALKRLDLRPRVGSNRIRRKLARLAALALGRALQALERGDVADAVTLSLGAVSGLNELRNKSGDTMIPPDLPEQPVAEVVEWLGHKFLKVGGITVAREGDVCRDATIFVSRWDEQAFREVCERLNTAYRPRSI